MKLHIQHRHHQPSPSLLALIRGQIEAFRPRLRIDEARVLVERREETSPPFRVAAHLVTPGPDIAAEGVDHTLHAALRKLVAQIEARLSHRRRKQVSRTAAAAPRALASAGARA
jgi:ribosome-associated translation inhibitor RaiA